MPLLLLPIALAIMIDGPAKSKKSRVGGMDWQESRGELPPGPRTLRGLFDMPYLYFHLLFGDGDGQQISAACQDHSRIANSKGTALPTDLNIC